MTNTIFEFPQIRILHYEGKLTPPQSPPLSKSSISSTCSFLFSEALPSLPLQTRKQSLREVKGDMCSEQLEK